ncbi:MAG: ATP-dependent helicase [Elusimicrobia bacterium]|nr:ATP-dependent helicase [Elusimicrobiota bacterium]
MPKLRLKAENEPIPSTSEQEILAGLNPEQEQAVLHGEGPLLVVAGAGTGKTTVLTRRVAHLIASHKAKPSEILALTFTDKAASEMEVRVDRLVPYGFVDVCVSTFHAFGDKLLREFALEMGLIPDFKVMTEGESHVFFKQHLFQMPLESLRPLGNPTKYAGAMLGQISRLKDEDISPSRYLLWAQAALLKAQNPEEKKLAQRHMELAQVYEKYEEIKSQEGLLDFGDQVVMVLKLFRERPEVLKAVQHRYRYILVDEFQDTNYSQFQLVRLLTGLHRNLTVVADDDQAIYKWRGACLANVLGFLDVYPEARVISITQNYRSTQTILDNAYRLVRYNDPDRLEVTQKISKKLKAQKMTGPSVRVTGFHLPEEEADWVAKKIQREVAEKKRSYADYAILVRSNDSAKAYLDSLNFFRIPWRFSAETQLLRSPEIKTLVSFLKVVADPYDSVFLYHLATSRFYQITPAEMAAINHEARITKRPLFEILSRPDRYQGVWNQIPEEAIRKIKSLLKDLQHFLNLSSHESTGRVLYQFLEQHKVLAQLARSDRWEDVLRAKTMARFFGILKRFGEMSLLDQPRVFVENIEAILEGESAADPEELEEDWVHVTTIHKAKGLEYPVVFMVHLVEDQFPARRHGEFLPLPALAPPPIGEAIPVPPGHSIGGGVDTHLAEERRLFYVAMTRAKEELYFSWSHGGTKRARRPSRFILEALEGPKEILDIKTQADPLRTIDLTTRPSSRPVSVELETLSRPVPDEEEIQLSAYSIDDYLTCPLKYKYINVLKLRDIVVHHHSVVYGSAIHEAIKAFNMAKLKENSLTLEGVWEIFQRAWVSEGFQSREHEEKRLARGKEVLRQFYESNKDAPAPKAVEEEFKFYRGRDRIVGRFDCVVERSEGPVVVDYKTSEVEDRKDADKEARSSIQMGLYAFGFEKKYNQPPASLELHFLESGIVGRVEPDQKFLGKTEKKIEEASRGIRARDFKAKPGYFTCSFCAYQWICPEAYHK